MPAVLAENAEPVEFRRRFHRPTGLETNSRVWLRMVASAVPTVTVNQNSIEMQPASAWPAPPEELGSSEMRFDITAALTEFNELVLRFPVVAQPAPGSLEEVFLQIVEANLVPS